MPSNLVGNPKWTVRAEWHFIYCITHIHLHCSCKNTYITISVSSTMVSMLAFQASDPSSILGWRNFIYISSYIRYCAYKMKLYSKGCNEDWTRDRRICNPMLYHWAIHPFPVKYTFKVYSLIHKYSMHWSLCFNAYMYCSCKLKNYLNSNCPA